MPALQRAAGNAQMCAGEITGMAMTFNAAVVPKTVQVDAGGITCR